jgi:hypothetical protein
MFLAAMNAALPAMLEALGEDILYTPKCGTARTIRAVFDKAFVEAEAGGEVGVAAYVPRARVSDADAPGARQGDKVTYVGVVYGVVGVEPDGTGTTLLILERIR